MNYLQCNPDLSPEIVTVTAKGNSYPFYCFNQPETELNTPSLVGLFKNNASGKAVLFDCRFTENPGEYLRKCDQQLLDGCDAIGLYFITANNAERVVDIKQDLWIALDDIRARYDISLIYLNRHCIA